MRILTAWCWVEIIYTQHRLSISTQHPYEKYGSDISLFEAYRDFIYHVLKKSCNAGRYRWLKPQLLTHMPWLATFRAPPWSMLDRIPPSIAVWGVIIVEPARIRSYDSSNPETGWFRPKYEYLLPLNLFK